MAYTTTKTDTDQTMADSLYDEQREAFEWLISQLSETEGQAFSLIGPAGSGKTYLVAALIERLQGSGFQPNVAVGTPTHQSKFVLQQKLPDGLRVEPQTIHSMLGLKMAYDYQGGRRLINDESREPQIPSGGTVIVDEASMLGKTQEWPHIQEQMWLKDTNWIFVGDDAQLPPVEDEPSPALKQPGPELEEIVRQAEGSPIIQASRCIREGDAFDEHVGGEIGTDGVHQTYDEQQMLDYAVELFSSEAFEENPYHARVLAGRNDCVKWWNHQITERLFDGEDEYQEGMWLIAQDSWMPRDFIELHNSQMIKVEEADKTVETITGVRFPVWKLECVTPSGKKKRVTTLAEDGEKRYNQTLKDRKQAAIEADSSDSGRKWKNYYELQEALADLRRGYSLTVHKSQGASIGHVLVDYEDIMTWPDSKTIQPLQYVATTRAEDELVLLRG